MSDFENRDVHDGFACKLWRGERMTLIGFDVEEPEPDLVGFSIEVKAPGQADFSPLLNRIAFSYPAGAANEVTGDRNFDSREAPFQKFRWVHFPWQPVDGKYTYRVTKRHMETDDAPLVAGTSFDIDIDQHAVTYDGLVDVGFTRNFASSQAYKEQFGNNADIIPVEAKDGLDFAKLDLRRFRTITESGLAVMRLNDSCFGDSGIGRRGVGRSGDRRGGDSVALGDGRLAA